MSGCRVSSGCSTHLQTATSLLLVQLLLTVCSCLGPRALSPTHSHSNPAHMLTINRRVLNEPVRQHWDDQFLGKYKIPITPGDYASMYAFKIQNRLNANKLAPLSQTDSPAGKICHSPLIQIIKITNLKETCVKKMCYLVLYRIAIGCLDDIPWKKVWLLPNIWLPTKLDISVKLIHKFYPAKSYIKNKFKKETDITFGFCNQSPETYLFILVLPYSPSFLAKTLWLYSQQN